MEPSLRSGRVEENKNRKRNPCNCASPAVKPIIYKAKPSTLSCFQITNIHGHHSPPDIALDTTAPMTCKKHFSPREFFSLKAMMVKPERSPI